MLPGAPGGVWPEGTGGVWLLPGLLGVPGLPEEGEGTPGGLLLPGWDGEELGELGGMPLGLLGELGLLGGGGGGLLFEEQAETSTTSDTRANAGTSPAVLRGIRGSSFGKFDMVGSSTTSVAARN